MAHEVLVHGVLVADHDDRGFFSCPSDPPGPLPGGHDGSGIAHEDAQIQGADVDAQFQGAGAHHGQELAADQVGLDGPAFLGQIPGTVGADPFAERSGLAAGPYGNEFGHLSGLGEDQGSEFAGKGRLQEHDGRVGCPGALTVEKDKMTFGSRASAFVHDLHIQSGQGRRQFARIGNGGRGKDECRLFSVRRTDPDEPSENPGHVRSHDSSVGVYLVHDDEIQVPEETLPVAVVGKNA